MAAGAQDFGAARMAGPDSGRMMRGMMPDSAMRRNGMGPGGMPGGMPPQGLGGMQGEVPEYKPECSAAARKVDEESGAGRRRRLALSRCLVQLGESNSLWLSTMWIMPTAALSWP